MLIAQMTSMKRHANIRCQVHISTINNLLELILYIVGESMLSFRVTFSVAMPSLNLAQPWEA